MDTSSSSKVTVEYHDPSGVFPLISNEIASRLPLKNLVWRSPTRPIRQIDSLHLDFVPDSFTSTSLRPPVQRTDSDGTTSFDIVRSGIDPRKNAVKERRHQIPGLQTSPYLKLYILRADDKDVYKSSERQKIREWIRDNAAANTKKAKGRSENHDAFEWVIVHVVIPNTVASSEPRWRESSKDPEELKERKTGMKLPGKSTRTVFDKLRADFNESGKSGQDRVAQIRLTRARVTADLLPPALATTIEETNEEREKTWNDLMIKFKTMILAMFDVRVRQYEMDVAEQDSRRALPGFNYCTFFIYKEGLAMAFESVGLVEDALVIYDELSLGFETVLKDIAKGESNGSATSFAPFTADIIDRINGTKQASANGAASESHITPGNMQAFQKDYREKIVRSDISTFDFSCYLFARQNALILRIANAKASGFGERSARYYDGVEDLVLISEVCWRAANFCHNAARSLRQDLYAYRAHQWEKQIESPLSEADVESLVSSWTYVVAGQMLHETYSPALENMNEPGKRESMPNGGPKHRAVASLGGVNAYPQRTTSLPSRKSRTSELQGRDSLQSASDSDLMSPPMSPGSDGTKSFGGAAGLIELVTYRADLLMIQRKMIEQIAKQRQWVAGWALMEESTRAMENVDLNGDAETSLTPKGASAEPSKLLAAVLDEAMRSKEAFHKKYEDISNKAMRLLISATQSKRAESIMGDLAILNYQQARFEYAASYFQHVLPFYAEEGWSLMEIEALRIHSMCLKELDRKEEYVVTLLALVAKACGWRKTEHDTSVRTPTFDEVADVSGVLPEALAFSRHLDMNVHEQAELYFAGMDLEREVLHHDDKDGFSLRLRFRHTLDDEVHLDQISAKLVHLEDPSTELWLVAANVTVTRGLNYIRLDSPTVTSGPFALAEIMMQTNKIVFSYEPPQQAKAEDETSSETKALPHGSFEVHKQPLVFIYPNLHALEAEMTLAPHVQIQKSRFLELSLRSGWNDIDNVDVRLRPATAGLRLHLADAISDDIRVKIDEDSQPGHIALDSLAPNTTATVKVPYSLEQAGLEILIRLEASYNTARGSFTFISSIRLQTRLPLDVDVNDLFQIDRLFSNFTIRATRQAPVLITNVDYAPSALYAVEGPPVLSPPMSVFERQPVKLLYKVTRKANSSSSVSKEDGSLMLSLWYCSLDDLVIRTAKQSFLAAVEATPSVAFLRLLLPFLESRIQRLLSPAAGDMALLLGEASIPSFDQMGWSELIAQLPRGIQATVEKTLRDWHSSNVRSTLEMEAIEAAHQRSITIPVEVPSVDFVHIVSLSLRQEHSRYPQDLSTLLLGQPVNARLSIASSTAWCSKIKSKPGDKESEDREDFTFDIQAESDCWLIGGQTRGHFRATEGRENIFNVLLIPLKLGSHALPHIDIQPARVEKTADGEEPAKIAEPVSSESHYESAGQIVRVLRSSQTSRVYVPESGSTRPVSRTGSTTTGKEGG